MNKGKGVYINMGIRNTIKFKDGTELKREEETDYLGAKLTKKNLNRREIEERTKKPPLCVTFSEGEGNSHQSEPSDSEEEDEARESVWKKWKEAFS